MSQDFYCQAEMVNWEWDCICIRMTANLKWQGISQIQLSRDLFSSWLPWIPYIECTIWHITKVFLYAKLKWWTETAFVPEWQQILNDKEFLKFSCQGIYSLPGYHGYHILSVQYEILRKYFYMLSWKGGLRQHLYQNDSKFYIPNNF